VLNFGGLLVPCSPRTLAASSARAESAEPSCITQESPPQGSGVRVPSWRLSTATNPSRRNLAVRADTCAEVRLLSTLTHSHAGGDPRSGRGGSGCGRRCAPPPRRCPCRPLRGARPRRPEKRGRRRPRAGTRPLQAQGQRRHGRTRARAARRGSGTLGGEGARLRRRRERTRRGGGIRCPACRGRERRQATRLAPGAGACAVRDSCEGAVATGGGIRGPARRRIGQNKWYRATGGGRQRTPRLIHTREVAGSIPAAPIAQPSHFAASSRAFRGRLVSEMVSTPQNAASMSEENRCSMHWSLVA
jgi:hypothetical protein